MSICDHFGYISGTVLVYSYALMCVNVCGGSVDEGGEGGREGWTNLLGICVEHTHTHTPIPPPTHIHTHGHAQDVQDHISTTKVRPFTASPTSRWPSTPLKRLIFFYPYKALWIHKAESIPKVTRPPGSAELSGPSCGDIARPAPNHQSA